MLVETIAFGLAKGGFGGGSLPLAIGSMGATAVLVYGLPDSPLSTPRNVIGGHMISALVGVVVRSAPVSISLIYISSPYAFAG